MILWQDPVRHGVVLIHVQMKDTGLQGGDGEDAQRQRKLREREEEG